MAFFYTYILIGSFFVVAIVYIMRKLNSVARMSIDSKNTIEQLTDKIDVIRNSMRFIKLDNLVTMNNELAKYREGVYEDEYFIQEVGECKILKITDKSNGEITHITYNESGHIQQTNSYLNDVLLFTMEYVNGKLETGNKYNQNGQKAFSYKYNGIGEIVSQNEYLYDENNQLTIKETTF